jgi:predicted O-linked N-acetylglucosamine transferase (SPINDLY family)
MATERILELATEHHLAGRTGEAEGLYREILATEPENPDALHRMGVLAMQKGDLAAAVRLTRQATERRPSAANIWASYGQVLAADGKPEAAAEAFERALHVRADLTEALFGLAVAQQTVGKRSEAVEAYRKLIALKPQMVEAHNNMGNALFGLGRLEEAVESYRKAIALKPDSADAMGNLGSALNALGRIDEAIETLQKGLGLRPDSALVCNNLGNALCARKRYEEASVFLRKALELKPEFAQASYNLGNALTGKGDYAGAVDMYRKAISIDPSYIDAHNNLGNALQGLRDYKGAAEAYLAALKIQPDFAVGYNNLGNALRTMSRTDDAILAFEQALKLKPDYHPAMSNLGNALKDAGRLDEALTCYRKVVELQPKDAISHSNLIFTMQYHPGCKPQEILHEALKWNALHAKAANAEIKPWKNEKRVDRPLRIGYVGADFRDHCQSLFTIPLFANHDRGRFEIFCYMNLARPDAVTERIRASVDEWQMILGVSDQSAAERIRADEIDILVDLTMHMSHGRPLIFARKPAPVQVAWLAYPGTTGLSAIDYRLTDHYLDPPGVDHLYSEKSVRLDSSFWCYDPLCQDLEPGPLPAKENGYVTFGCLNNFCKVTQPTLEMWVKVLSRVHKSRLMLLAAQGAHRNHLREFFRNRGIYPDRIHFMEFHPRRKYLEAYRGIDIGLDTIPYNGHTTSLDSFWMGVPVVTRIDNTAVGRAGLSQLSNLGMTELAAATDDEFAKIATSLAGNTGQLSELRAGLRKRMELSPLMDPKAFAGSMESAYLGMWKTYCAT